MLIYHTSDLHDHRGIARTLREIRARAPGLLADCGDSLRGSQTVYRRSEPMIDDMNEAGYDVGAMGNREFHYLFGCVRARLSKMTRPVVCSNLIDLRGRPLPFKSSVSLACDGTKVHFIGLLVTQYPRESLWERIFGWRFLDPLAVAAGYAQSVLPGEPLVVLSHLGLRMDRKLAAAVPRITLLLGGHSHDTLHEPEIVSGVPIVHAGPYGRYVSRTQLAQANGAWRMTGSTLLPLLP